MKHIKERLEYLNESNMDPIEEEMTDHLISKKCYKKGGYWYKDGSLLIGNNPNREILLTLDAPEYSLMPKLGIIKKNFSVASNEKDGMYKLDNCKNFPKEVGGNIMASYNNFTNLKGFTKKVGGNISLNDCKLTSLIGLPKEIHGLLRIEGNPLTSLKGIPLNYNNELSLSDTHLKDLKTLPSNIKIVNIFGCRKIETITHVIGRDLKIHPYKAINKATKMVEYEMKIYSPNITKNKFFSDLLLLMVKDKIDYKAYKFWPKGFLNSNLGKSAKSIGKFNL